MFKKNILFKNSQVCIFLFFFLLLGYLLVINFFMPLWFDDYGRSLPLASWTAVFPLVEHTYFEWSGRIAVMFFTFLFLWRDSLAIPIFNILNSLVFVLMIYLLFLNAFAKKPISFTDFTLLIIVFSLFWFLPTSLGEVAFWKTGSIGYLWPLTGTLAFIYPVTRLLFDNSNVVSDNFIIKILFLIAGLVLGTCLENLSATICFFLVGGIVYLKYRKYDCPKWLYYATSGYIAGAILLISAPGNFKRAATITEHYSLLYKFSYLIFRIAVHFIPFVIIFLLIILLLKKVKHKISPEQFKRFYLFLGLSLLTAFAMGGVPNTVLFGGRLAFATDVFAIVALASLLPIFESAFYANFIRPIILFVLLPLFVLDMTNVFIFYRAAFTENKLREVIIAKNIAQNNKNVVVPPMSIAKETRTWFSRISAYRFYANDIISDKNTWRNRVVTEYYGLDSISLGEPTSAVSK